MRSVLDKESLQVIDEHKARSREEEETTNDVGSTTLSETQSHDQTLEGKKRRRTSAIWKHFTFLDIDKNGVERVACNYCGTPYITGNGTSTLLRHFEACKKKPSIDDLGKSKQIDHMVVREMTAKIIVYHDLPFSFVEYKMVRDLFKYLNEDYKFISRHTVALDVYRLYEKKKENLKVILAASPHRVCLTSDIWTGCTVEGYMCLTAHFIDESWKLNSKILSFCALPPPHSGVEIAKKLLDCLVEWGIERKVFSLTLDNASANDNMQELVKEHLCLTDGLLCKGEFFHVRCCAHILNLIVQDGLKVIADALHKIRESVKYVTASESRSRLFENCLVRVGRQSGVGLSLDVPTRWNSTYTMLSRALKYESAFASLKLYDKNYKFCPSQEEWAMGDRICEILEPFEAMTNLMSGSKYPTSNLYFTQVWTIQCLLKTHAESEIAVIRNMVTRMQDKFDKYWEEYSVVLAMSAVLDPRMKLQLLE